MAGAKGEGEGEGFIYACGAGCGSPAHASPLGRPGRTKPSLASLREPRQNPSETPAKPQRNPSETPAKLQRSRNEAAAEAATKPQRNHAHQDTPKKLTQIIEFVQVFVCIPPKICYTTYVRLLSSIDTNLNYDRERGHPARRRIRLERI